MVLVMKKDLNIVKFLKPVVKKQERIDRASRTLPKPTLQEKMISENKRSRKK
jgi:hypothetical protein